jgi:hypothetical protein
MTNRVHVKLIVILLRQLNHELLHQKATSLMLMLPKIWMLQ